MRVGSAKRGGCVDNEAAAGFERRGEIPKNSHIVLNMLHDVDGENEIEFV